MEHLLPQLENGAVLEGPHWTEPVRVLAVKVRGARIELQSVGLHSKRLWNKLLKADDFDGAIRITQPGQAAALSGNPTHFRLAAEAHRIRLAYQYDPHFAVSVSQVDPLPHQMDAVYSHLLIQPQIRFLIADKPGAGKTIMAGLVLKELKFRGLVERTLIVTPANLTDQWRTVFRGGSRKRFETLSTRFEKRRWNMPGAQTTLKGVIHGKTIELEQESGLPDGQSVAVLLQPLHEERFPPGEGIRRSAGAWADDPQGLDEYLKQLRQDREQDRPPIEP